MTEETRDFIPLHALHEWEGNVRQTVDPGALDELTASIAAHGLLQSLVVREESKGRFAVVAGKRRLRALNRLAASGKIAPDYGVACRVIPAGTAAGEISLAENVVREPMHPADQFEAFNALVREGEPVADIAARFGVSETVVRQRLRLANVAPPVMDKFRAGDLSLEQVQAFAVSDDQERQVKVLESFGKKWKDDEPENIRKNLITKKEVPASDPRVRYVTLPVYEQAGGAVKRDLFTEGEDGVFVTDVKLLDKLVEQQAAAEAEKLKAEGWAWVEFRPKFESHRAQDIERKKQPQHEPLTAEAKEKIMALTAEAKAIEKAAEDRVMTDQESRRTDEIDEQIEFLEENRAEKWPKGFRETAGVVLSLDRHGLERSGGWVKKPEKKEKAKSGKAAAREAEKKKEPDYSRDLLSGLFRSKSAVIAAVLALKPETALAVTAMEILRQVFFNDQAAVLRIEINETDYEDTGRAGETLAKMRQQWGKKLPDRKQLFDWCLKQDRETLVEIISFCALSCVDTPPGWRGWDPKDDEVRAINGLARHIGADIAAWWQPTAENYFSHVPQEKLLADLKDALGAAFVTPEIAKKSKKDLAVLAEREIKTKAPGWLPEPMRVPGFKAPAAEPSRAAAAVAASKKADAGPAKAKAAKKPAAKPKKKAA